MKAYKANRMVVSKEKNLVMLIAEEYMAALLNLDVPSPIFRDTDPIKVLVLLVLARREKKVRWFRLSETCEVELVEEDRMKKPYVIETRLR